MMKTLFLTAFLIASTTIHSVGQNAGSHAFLQELNLTAEQQPKFLAIQQAMTAKWAEFQKMPAAERQSKQAAFYKARQEEMKQLLTPEQMEKYQEIRARRNGGNRPADSPTTNRDGPEPYSLSDFSGKDTGPLKATMLNKGATIFEKNFDDQKEVDDVMDLRKHTKGTVNNGVMVTFPPSVHGEAPPGAPFAKEEFVRSHFKLGGQDYIFSFRVKFLELDREVGEQISFIEIGHRWIRLELSPKGSQLVFQNYILDERRRQVIVENNRLTLEYGEWYEGTVEISGDETLFNINGELFHLKDDLIAKKRDIVHAQKFCLDLRGVGYLLDYAAAWEPNGFQDTWEETREDFKKEI
ncbi:MAG: hypothetical protein AAF357_00875 [Verrucomicrobiota bacterium]